MTLLEELIQVVELVENEVCKSVVDVKLAAVMLATYVDRLDDDVVVCFVEVTNVSTTEGVATDVTSIEIVVEDAITPESR